MTQIERVFIRFRGRTIGPLTPDKVKDMVRRGQVTRMHELSGDGLSWMKADEFGNFFPRAVASGGMAGDMAASASSVPPGGEGSHGEGGAAPAASDNATAQWYAHVNGEKQGPVSMDQMRLYSEAKILKKDSLVWKNGMDTWKPAAEVIPELFGGAAAKSGQTIVSHVDSETPPADGGALATELAKHHALILAFGVSLLIIAAIFMVGQIVALNQGGRKLKSDTMSAAIRISLSGVAAIAGVMAVQASVKLKAAAQSSSAIAALMAARTLNQFWLLTSVAVMIWLGILLLVLITALATNVPITNVLA
ncbi:hypothetical protein Enr13x_29790 [Stieleria neptunia]|uniref:GYF domain-containing protein n=1 Tax=Stieleria neptunia TaxID=2527979 RepID=A0A518HQJ6_9BACT|nr:DUF4339 domain-containing protein [Stieleria neptunia]QDV43125.1 hypothetical protein Enr13x_29790 [Stieleria neptunia]